MIVVAPSALFAVLLNEPESGRMKEMLVDQAGHIAAPSVVEARDTAWRRGRRALRDQLLRLMDVAALRVVAFDERMTDIACDAYDRFGKGRGEEPAALNFGDCFSYGLAKSLNAPLLFKGDDFRKTDVLVAEIPDG